MGNPMKIRAASKDGHGFGRNGMRELTRPSFWPQPCLCPWRHPAQSLCACWCLAHGTGKSIGAARANPPRSRGKAHPVTVTPRLNDGFRFPSRELVQLSFGHIRPTIRPTIEHGLQRIAANVRELRRIFRMTIMAYFTMSYKPTTDQPGQARNSTTDAVMPVAPCFFSGAWFLFPIPLPCWQSRMSHANSQKRARPRSLDAFERARSELVVGCFGLTDGRPERWTRFGLSHSTA